MATKPRKLISFDWAIKKILRRKANFEVLEGFLSELLFEDIKITEILESESNKNVFDDKFNRLDIKAHDYPHLTSRRINRPPDFNPNRIMANFLQSLPDSFRTGNTIRFTT